MPDLYPRIREALSSLPEAQRWPQLVDLADDLGGGSPSLPFWEYPLVACQAAGTDPARALPAASAVFCLVASIRLVDDMLDEEEDAPYRRLGAGRAANLALAFQAAAHRLAGGGPEVQQEVASAALRTALGQHLDVESEGGEEAFWEVAAAKTPPLVESGLVLGALFGNAPTTEIPFLRSFGRSVGLLVQINDDLADAMETPAAPDWQRPRANLALLYALEAEHPERVRFRALQPRVSNPADLEEAQEILVRSGAVSYCAAHLARLHRDAGSALDGAGLPAPEPLRELLGRLIAPLERLLRLAGVDDPTGLFEGA